MQALVDNDVLLKSAAYGLLATLLASQPYGANNYAMLGTAKFVVPKRMKKQLESRHYAIALVAFQEAQKIIVTLEPDETEIKLAAEFERFAQENNLQLDSGESQLCAVLLTRGSTMIFTGDKRAIVAMGALVGIDEYQALSGRVVCMEQLFLWLINKIGHSAICAAICPNKKIDTALTLCFGCHSGGAPLEGILEGLNSHIQDLRRKAPGVLHDAC